MNRKKALVAKSPKDYKLLWMVLPFIVRQLSKGGYYGTDEN